MTKDLSCYSVYLQATSTLLQAMDYSLLRLVLAVVANRACSHKSANDNCRHICESYQQMTLTPKGFLSFTQHGGKFPLASTSK